nr:transposase [Desulforhopalus sp. IMCC35007]
MFVFPWATYRKTKGAMKLHFGLDTDRYLQVFMDITDGKTHDLEWARPLGIPAGSFIVFDRGDIDYKWYGKLDKQKITFITRLKGNSGAYKFGNRRSQIYKMFCPIAK